MSSSLPVHLTDFIGRQREIDDLTALVRSARLVTLTGAGGSGKTRLASEIAGRANAWQRVAWVDLAGLSNPDMLAQHVGETLQVPDRTDATAVKCIVRALCGEQALLVLDNCEHLVDASAALVDALLRGCPHLTVVATSRAALGVANETAWLVPPLASDDAVRLFAERARTALPSFALSSANTPAVTEICRRLDGIPLAIELAAARVRVLSPEQILERLDDAFRLLTGGSRSALPRHRTLRATMEWSHALLSEREQVLLRRLSVFAGTFGLEAVEAVCAGSPLEIEDLLDGLTALVDRSLVVMEAGEGEARYRVLETVRQYGRERLIEAHEVQALERQHALHYLAVVEEAAPNMVGGANSIQIVARLSRDHDNLRTAVGWAMADPSRVQYALRFTGALFWYWYTVGHFREARQLTDIALAMPGQTQPLHRGRALAASALTALAQGEWQRSQRDFERAIPLLQEGGDAHGVAAATAKYAAAILLSGDLARAIPILDQAVQMAKSWPWTDVVTVFAHFWRGWAAYREGNLTLAREMIQSNVDIARTASLPTSLGHALVTLSRVELAMGNVEDACNAVLEGLEVEVAINDGWGIALGLDAVGFAAARRGRYEDAVRIFAATEAHRERLAVALPVLSQPEHDAMEQTLKRELGARFDAVCAEGRAMTTAQVVSMALQEAARHTSEHRVPIAAAPVDESRPRLRVLALGSLEVYVGGRQVDAAAWGSARPRELFVYLLMHPEGRTKDQVGLVFWPDASVSQLRNNFHVTLHRLRKALGGQEWVTLVNDRYRIDPALVQEFDALDFAREVKDATRAVERGESGAVAKLESAVAQYRGDFMDGEPVGDWHLEHRDHLQKLYIDALMLLGARHEVEKRHARAAEVYARVLARDELHEDALLALLRAHAALGERTQALRLYRRFADRMRAELGADPGSETVRFVEGLMA